MPSEIENLLSAEQEVQNLLAELHELKTQVGGYDTAKQSLEAVRHSLLKLVEETTALAAKAHAATEKLRDIGTPEILARSESIRQSIAELRAQVTSRSEALGLAVTELAGEVTARAEANLLAITESRTESAKGTSGLRKLVLAGLAVSIVSALITLAVLIILIKR
jgi:hypothetical protein